MLNVNNIEEIQMTTNINIPSLSGKTFGIEVEFLTNHYQDDFVELLNRKLHEKAVADPINVNSVCVYEACYSDNDATRWRIKTDGSLSGTRDHRNGLELVSPIMQYEGCVKDFYHILQAMDEIGVSVNRTCGLHVHIGMDDVTTDQIHNILERYSAFESQIDQMMPRSRRDNNAYYASSINSSDIRNIKRAKTKRAIANSMERYKKCNTESLTKHNTLEFRHHSGTTNYEKIINWVHIVMMHVETSIKLTNQLRPRNTRKNRPFNELRTLVESKGFGMKWKAGKNVWMLLDPNGYVIQSWSAVELDAFHTGERVEGYDANKYDLIVGDFVASIRCEFVDDFMNGWFEEETTIESDEGFTTGLDQNVKSYINERIADLASA